MLIKGTRGSSHTLPQSCCPHAVPDTAPSPGPALLPWRSSARHWTPGACHEDGHRVGGPAADPEGSRLHPPLLLVYQGAAGLMAAGSCLLPAGTMASIAQVGRVGQTGGMAAASVAKPASQLPILFFSTQPNPHQDSWGQLCLTKDGPQTMSEV